MSAPTNEIYAALRSRLLSGAFQAGQRVKPDDLRAEFGVSASTVRESLLQLATEGFLNLIDQRGFRVPQSSETTLKELADLRILLEQRAVRETLANASLRWDSELIAAHHRLAHIEAEIANRRNVDDHVGVWTDAERGFHQVLISGCESQVLLDLHAQLFDRYRQMLVLNFGHMRFGFREDNKHEHEQILAAALARDADACCEMIAGHIVTGMHAVRQSFEAALGDQTERTGT